MDINFKLKQRILEMYDTQEMFATALGIHPTTVSHVIRYRWNLRDDEKEMWAERLRCKVEDIF